jgi:hypothetical protein
MYVLNTAAYHTNFVATCFKFSVSTITEVYSVKQLNEKRKMMAHDINSVTHYGVLHAVLTHLNIDEDPTDVVRTLW